VVVHACHPSCAGNVNRRVMAQTILGINRRPCWKKQEQKEQKGVAQMAQHLSSKCKNLNSNCYTAKKKKKKENFFAFHI
jgi:hypothetical protein